MYCIVHGSYRKDLDLISQIADMFRLADINVISPPRLEVINSNEDFIRFSKYETSPNQVESALLEQMRAIKNFGFCYFVNPRGNLGSSASYELAHAQNVGLPVYFFKPLTDLPANIKIGTVWQPYDLVRFLKINLNLPSVSAFDPPIQSNA